MGVSSLILNKNGYEIKNIKLRNLLLLRTKRNIINDDYIDKNTIIHYYPQYSIKDINANKIFFLSPKL